MTNEDLKELLNITYKEVYELGSGLHHDYIVNLCDDLIKDLDHIISNIMINPVYDKNMVVICIGQLLDYFKMKSGFGQCLTNSLFDEKVKPVTDNATNMIIEGLQQSPLSEKEDQDYYSMFKEAREKQNRDMFNKIVEKGLKIAGDDPEARKRAIEGAAILSKYMK